MAMVHGRLAAPQGSLLARQTMTVHGRWRTVARQSRLVHGQFVIASKGDSRQCLSSQNAQSATMRPPCSIYSRSLLETNSQDHFSMALRRAAKIAIPYSESAFIQATRLTPLKLNYKGAKFDERLQLRAQIW